jgi:hypothetical protein
VIVAPSSFGGVGDYEIQIGLKSLQANGNSPLSNAVQVRIEPSNSNNARRSSETLAQAVRQATSAEERIQYARALGEMGLPESVPSIMDLTGREWGIDSFLIRGIEKVGDMSAVDALGSLLVDSKSEASIFARSALNRLAKSASDQKVQNRAQQLLSPARS